MAARALAEKLIQVSHNTLHIESVPHLILDDCLV